MYSPNAIMLPILSPSVHCIAQLVVGRLRHTLPSDFPFAEVGGLCEALVGVGRTEEAAQQLDLVSECVLPLWRQQTGGRGLQMLGHGG